MRILIFFSILLIIGCNPTPESTTQSTGDFTGYTITEMTNGAQRATKKAPEGFISEMGHIVNGKKEGQWIYYDKNNNITKSENYINGVLNGAVVDLRNGRVQSVTHYLGGELDGRYIKYAGNSPEEIAEYKNGELHGKYQKFNRRNLIQEVDFKHGVQDGYMRYYDEDGNITMEYVYENGEKVSGGMVNQ